MKILALILAFLRPGGLFDMFEGPADALGFNKTQPPGGWAGGPGSQVPVYVPTGQAQADQYWQQLMQSMYGQGSRNAQMLDPQIMAAYQRMQSINTQPLVQAGQQAGQSYGDLANMSQMYSGQLGNQANRQFNAGQDIYNMGRDPQNQLHDYLQHQTVENARSASSARGLGMGAQSAGLENQATQQFNMDWQNQLFDRALAGLGGMGQANRMGNADLAGSMAFGQQTPGYQMQSAQAPIQGQEMAYGMPMHWADMFTQSQNQNVFGPQHGLQTQMLPYLGYGAGAGGTAYNAALGKSDFKLRDDQSKYDNMMDFGKSMFSMFGGGK